MKTITLDYNEFEEIKKNADKNNIKRGEHIEWLNEIITDYKNKIVKLENKLHNTNSEKIKRELNEGKLLLELKTNELEKEYRKLNDQILYYNENNSTILIKYFIYVLVSLIGIISAIFYFVHQYFNS